MVSVDNAVIARIKLEGNNFEILVNGDKALQFKEGHGKLEDALVTNDIFSDVKKGLHASEHLMEKLFRTKDKKKIAEEIIKKGEVQLTAEHLKNLREENRRRIINLIHKNSVDPRTNLPHPEQRIENALQEAKVNIDAFKAPELQVQDIVKKIRVILPLKYELREIAIKIPAQYAAKSYSTLKHLGKILHDEWQSDGSLVAVVEIPAGMQSELFDELNKLTQGSIETKILKTK